MVSRVILVVAVIVVVIVVGLAAAFALLSSSTSTNISQTSSSSTGTTSGNSITINGNYTSSWLTYHLNLVRDGYDADEPSYKTVAPSLAWKSPMLDGAIYAEPLVYKGNVYVATENDSVYALSEATGQVVWRTNLGTPVPGNTLPCGDIDPSGITGTPAIDPLLDEIFVVAYLYPPQNHVLFALNTDDGKVIFQRNVNPPGVSPLTEQQRAALSLANGTVYIGFGGLAGDCGVYHGYLLGVHEDNSSATLSYQVPTTREGAIWATAGVAIDSTGIYVATGNGASNSVYDFSNAVIHLSFNLTETDYFAPTNWVMLSNYDLDLGSVAPTLLGNDTIFQIGKQGVGYLLNESKLGGIGGQEYSAQVCDGSFGGTAYVPPVIYVPCSNGMFALNVTESPTANFGVLWNNTSFDAGPPIVAGGAVWTIDQNSGMLYALDAQSGAIVFKYLLGSSVVTNANSTITFKYLLGGVVHFETPSSAGGLLFAGGADSIYAFSI
jgi:outer membrane protein assembly factor BamB